MRRLGTEGAMGNEELRGGVSRRTAIKSVAAGTAVVWAAPAITTMGGAAMAQGSPVCDRPVDFVCGDNIPVICGHSGPYDECVCDLTVEGRSVCWENAFCTDEWCTSEADCPDGMCVDTCCGRTCLPVCGTDRVTTTTSGPNAAGR